MSPSVNITSPGSVPETDMTKLNDEEVGTCRREQALST
jgi:hypothetical protein